jgi:hypothetical protein
VEIGVRRSINVASASAWRRVPASSATPERPAGATDRRHRDPRAHGRDRRRQRSHRRVELRPAAHAPCVGEANERSAAIAGEQRRQYGEQPLLYPAARERIERQHAAHVSAAPAWCASAPRHRLAADGRGDQSDQRPSEHRLADHASTASWGE